ncbi:MAG: DUF4282 domain-containing protein [Candidatus Magasanikbacteria bacterium]
MKNIRKKITKYLNDLFDFSFKEFITVSVLKVVYWLEVVLGALLATLTIVEGFEESMLLGVLALIVSPVLFFIYLIVWRVILETIAVVFRIAEGVKEISKIFEETKKETGSKIKIEKYEVEETEKDKKN